MSDLEIHVPDGEELTLAGQPSECSYLPDRESLMEFRLTRHLTSERYRHLLERGWRRFGMTLFRPICATCRECQSLRVDVQNFAPTKSQRRNRNRNQDISVQICRPELTDDHLRLYNDFHGDMHQRRGWRFQPTTTDDYYDSHLAGQFEFSTEFQYRLDGRLVGVGLVDRVSDSSSSCYFYHDPALRQRGLGTYSVLCEIEALAATAGCWVYLGYYIRDCGSMNYKNRFGPHQLMNEYGGLDEVPRWFAPDSQ